MSKKVKSVKIVKSNESVESEEKVNTDKTDDKTTKIIDCITRDDLRSNIHDIHNFLRNNGAGYGQTGVKIFSIFYGLKLIQPYLHKLKLSEEQKKILNYDNLVKKSKTKNEITEYIDKNVLGELFELKKNNDFAKFIFYEIPKDLKDHIWKQLILRIEELPVGYKEGSKVNLSGKVWEYFVGRDETAISELGAYFTDRHITNFIFGRLNPELDENNNIKTMIDPFGGSGGFTLGYANYLRENFDNIDWKKNVNNIYHYDMEESVVNMTGLEMFAITGEFPKINDNNNFIRQNSFTDNFCDISEKYRYFDYIITNPPYGGDKLNKNAEQIKRDKILAYLKKFEVKTEIQEKQIDIINKENKEYKTDQLKHQVNLDTCSKRIKEFAKKYNIDNANDKEACSLILLIDLLAENGTCCGVLKEGPFFDGKYSKLRKVLIDNYNVTDVISVPQNAFENTGTKTSIIIFHNNGKTKKVNFSELIVNLEKEDVFGLDDKGFVKLTKIKDEIIDVVEHKLCTATYKQISDPTIIKKGKTETKKYDYSLNYKNYMDYKVFCPDGYELKKLGDMCDIIDGYAFKSADFVENDTDQIIDHDHIDDRISIIQISNINNYKINDTCNDKKVIKNDKYKKYLANIDDIILGLTGNIQEKIAIYHNHQDKYLNQRTCALRSFENNSIKNYVYSYWIFNKIGEFIQNKSNGSVQKNLSKEDLKEIQIPVPINITKLKKPLESLQKLHQQITQDTEAIPAKEKAICELIKKLTDEGREGVDYDSHKLGDVCEIDKDINKFETHYGKDTGKYNFHTGSEKNYLYCENYNINEGIIINRTNGSGICNIKYDKYFCAAKQTFILTSKNIRYIFYNLKGRINEVEKGYDGACHKNLANKYLNDFPIKVLKTNIIKNKLQEKFDEIDQLKDTLESNKKQHQEQINKLFENFKEPEELTNITKTNNNIRENNIPEDTPEETPNNTPADTPDITPEEDSEEEPEYETIEHEGKNYYLDGKKVYRINKDKSLGKYYGRYKNDKVIRASEEANKEEKKIVVKAKANVKAKE